MITNQTQPSVRAQITERRTYLRPTNKEGTTFETFPESVDRMVSHQRWLWERARGGMTKKYGKWVMEPLGRDQIAELAELKELLLARKVNLSGRTRWLGGTEVSRTRESSSFNCAFLEVSTVHDVVDVLWLLLQGCGVGFRPVIGNLNGFTQSIKDIQIIRSKRTEKGGHDENRERFNKDTKTWTIVIGDSAEAWAKSIGKLMAGKYKADKLIIDLRQIRPAGERLSGYGWISSGDEQIAKAFKAIAELMSANHGKLLTRMNILDIINWLGTVLSSRRSAEIALFEVGEPEWEDFAVAKKDYWAKGNDHRAQSNNSLMFYHKPERKELVNIFGLMVEAGGSEPGFYNMMTALQRAPWAKGTNPCGEIFLGNHNFCNLVETVVCRFNGNLKALLRAHYIIARANYRQTCVNLDDGILQRSWHELNEFLRLTGVGVTGVVAWSDMAKASSWEALRKAAHKGVHSMADELHMPRSKLVTTIKPSGTQSKASGLEGMEIPEGVHKPLGRFIFNNMNMSKHDPLVDILREANYHIFPNPNDSMNVLARLPVEYSNIPFTKKSIKWVDMEINLESAIEQLERYKMTMVHYTDHNTSVTISYDVDEVDDIIDWCLENWDNLAGVSFLFRNDPTKTAEDLGYQYLPQEVVDKKTFQEYTATLKPINWLGSESELTVDSGADCTTGACPVT